MPILNLTSIIIDIQKQLILAPYDLAHDITHHYWVYEWCMKIIEREKLNVDKDIITLCAWLHDLGGRKGEHLEKTVGILTKHELNKHMTVKITRIIKEHSLGKKQTLLESKILYDADKLEYVNPFRLQNFMQSAKDGYISRKKYRQYKREWWEKIGGVKKTLHFLYAKKEFSGLLPKAKKIMC